MCHGVGACLGLPNHRTGSCACDHDWQGAACTVSSYPLVNCTSSATTHVQTTEFANHGKNLLAPQWCASSSATDCGASTTAHTCASRVPAGGSTVLWLPDTAQVVRMEVCSPVTARCYGTYMTYTRDAGGGWPATGLSAPAVTQQYCEVDDDCGSNVSQLASPRCVLPRAGALTAL